METGGLNAELHGLIWKSQIKVITCTTNCVRYEEGVNQWVFEIISDIVTDPSPAVHSWPS